MCPNRNDHNKDFLCFRHVLFHKKPYNFIFVTCSVYWDCNSLIVSDGTDYIFRVKHFINYIETNILIFITGMIIKFSLTKEANEVFDSLFLSRLKRLEKKRSKLV